MGCRKCGVKAAAKVALTFKEFSVEAKFDAVEQPLKSIAASEEIVVVAQQKALRMPAGKLMRVPQGIADELVKQGAPVWILSA